MVQTAYINQSVLPGFPGQRIGAAGTHKAKTLVNDAGVARQVMDVTISTAVDATAYTIVLNGLTVSITSGASTTKTLIRDAIITSIRNTPEFAGVVAAQPLSTDKIRFTSLVPGTAFTLTESDANIGTPATVTANATQSTIPFGRAIVRRNPSVQQQIDEVTIDTEANATAYTVTITSTNAQGVAVSEAATITSDADGTKTEIKDALVARINALAEPNEPFEDVIYAASSGTDKFKIYASNPGTPFTATAGANMTNAASQANATQGTGTSYDNSGALPSAIGQAFQGVLERIHSVVDPLTSGTSPVGAGPTQDMTVVFEGEIWVETDEAVQKDGPVYYRCTGTATDIGKFRNDADSGTCDYAPNCRFNSSTAGRGLVKLVLNLPA